MICRFHLLGHLHNVNMGAMLLQNDKQLSYLDEFDQLVATRPKTMTLWNLHHQNVSIHGVAIKGLLRRGGAFCSSPAQSESCGETQIAKPHVV